jgi:deoxyribonuclease V
MRLVAGADVAYAEGRVFACVVLLSLPGLSVVRESYAELPAAFPYVPGLLAYREGPAVLAAFDQVPRPDVVLFDAAGVAHPRRFGLARALGYALDVPSVGCAKSVLVGTCAEPGPRVGDRSWLIDGRERIGVALRTRERVRPVFVSRGWSLSLDDCVRVVLDCGGGYRLPEPTRLADIRVAARKRESGATRSSSI